MAGPDIATRVSALLERAGSTFGTGKLTCALRPQHTQARSWDAAAIPDPVDITAIQSKKTIRDGNGTIQKTVRMLLVDPLGPIPVKGDTVAIGVASAAVVEATRFERIEMVDVVQPASTVLLYEVMLAD